MLKLKTIYDFNKIYKNIETEALEETKFNIDGIILYYWFQQPTIRKCGFVLLKKVSPFNIDENGRSLGIDSSTKGQFSTVSKIFRQNKVRNKLLTVPETIQSCMHTTSLNGCLCS